MTRQKLREKLLELPRLTEEKLDRHLDRQRCVIPESETERRCRMAERRLLLGKGLREDEPVPPDVWADAFGYELTLDKWPKRTRRAAENFIKAFRL